MASIMARHVAFIPSVDGDFTHIHKHFEMSWGSRFDYRHARGEIH